MFLKDVLCLVVVFILSVNCEDELNALQYDKDKFNDQIEKAPHFVKFYAPWCGHCKRLAPTWDELGKKYNVEENKEKVVIAKVDCTQETALCSEHGVTGYPTLKFYNKDPKQGEKYRGGRDLDALSKYVDQQLGEKEEESEEDEDTKEEVAGTPEKENGVYILGQSTFSKHIEKGSHFIKFYAPWCGHCKRLAPTWDELGQAFSEDSDVTIAKVDCTQHRDVCSSQDVRGYPTILWFSGGEKASKYASGRDLDSLKEYVNSMKAKKNEAADSTADKVPEKKQEEATKEGDVYVLNGDNFDATVATGLSFIKFYAPWCGHCKRLAPTWEQLGGAFKGQENVKIAKVDCTVTKELCSKHGVRGYPTLKFFKDGESIGEHNSGRDLDSLTSSVQSKLPQKQDDAAQAEQEVAPGPVLDLNAGNFESSIAKGTSFIKFFAPWCGHCKRLAPTWEELGQKFADKSTVNIGKVDCTQHGDLCTKYEVRGYPTLKLFQNGEEVTKYSGGRDLESLANFVDSKGPHDEL